MNDYIFIGKIVNTHGIKGELRIKSDFERKDLAFKINHNLYIGDNKIKEVIKSYRVHKGFDMVTLSDYTNINEVLKYLQNNVYLKRSELDLNDVDYLMSDLIGMHIILDQQDYGIVTDYINNSSNVLLVVTGKKDYYIPFVKEYIVKVDIKEKNILTQNIKDLML